MKNKIKFDEHEKQILNQVPPDYYQKGINQNKLQNMWHKGKLRIVLSLIENDPQSILDVGSASGWFLNELHKKYPKAKCYGVDKYKKAVDYGNKKYKKLNLKYADAHSLPYKAKSFDLVVCAEVLEHVKDPEKVLKEIKRVLKKDGIAIIEMDSGNFLFRAAWYWWTNMRHGVWQDAHVHLFNVNKLEKIIKKSGFRITKKKIFNFSMGVAFLLEKK